MWVFISDHKSGPQQTTHTHTRTITKTRKYRFTWRTINGKFDFFVCSIVRDEFERFPFVWLFHLVRVRHFFLNSFCPSRRDCSSRFECLPLEFLVFFMRALVTSRQHDGATRKDRLPCFAYFIANHEWAHYYQPIGHTHHSLTHTHTPRVRACEIRCKKHKLNFRYSQRARH